MLPLSFISSVDWHRLDYTCSAVSLCELHPVKPPILDLKKKKEQKNAQTSCGNLIPPVIIRALWLFTSPFDPGLPFLNLRSAIAVFLFAEIFSKRYSDIVNDINIYHSCEMHSDTLHVHNQL